MLSRMPPTPVELGDTAVMETTDAASSGPASGAAPRIGSVLAGRYELLAVLGSGGMGTVCSAHDRELDEVVALKLLRPELAQAPGGLDRFRREVKLARRITHRNVARTFELGEHAGQRFLTMELVAGASLAERLRQRGGLAVGQAVPIFLAVCDALEAAHEAGIVHRDIKPDNVLLEPQGRVVVTDFGIAAFRDERAAGADLGATSGTPAYMAPEQLEGGQPTPQTDLYALGAMMFEVLTGELPWRADTVLSAMMRRLMEPPPDPRARVPGLPVALASVVVRCMQRAPDERPASAMAVARELRAALAEPALAPACADLPSDCEPAAPEPRGAAARTLAVLPFTREPALDEVMVAALAEDLADALGARKGLRVLAYRAGARGDPHADPLARGHELGVGLVIDGSVRSAGEQLSVGLRLIDTATGFLAWTGRFEAAPGRLLAVQGEATRAIAAALALEGGPPDREAPTDPAVLELYLRARQHYNLFTPADLRRAVELYTDALERDPDNPMIASALSMAYVRLSYAALEFSGLALETAQRVAERASLRAPHLAEPHLALSHLRLRAGDPVAAARHARAAVARSPSSAESHELLGRLLLESARVPDAVRRLEAGLGLDPRLAMARWELLRLAALDGDWARFDRLCALIPESERRTRWSLNVRFAGWRRDTDELARLDAAIHHDPAIPATQRQLLEDVLAVYRGHPERAEPVIHALCELAAHTTLNPRSAQWFLQIAAEVAAFVGPPERALAVLEQASDVGVFDLLWVDRCPFFADLREAPTYRRVRKQVRARADAVAEAVWG
jgi:eukaryotic-like serine/threonine-protein kinase